MCFKYREQNKVYDIFKSSYTPACTSQSSHTWFRYFTFIEKYCSHFLLPAPHGNARDNVLMTTMLSKEENVVGGFNFISFINISFIYSLTTCRVNVFCRKFQSFRSGLIKRLRNVNALVSFEEAYMCEHSRIRICVL